jgi:uncharacterized membrane protein
LKSLNRVETAVVVVVTVQALAAAAIWGFGTTGPIPMHFSGGGVDRWGDRHQVAGLLAGLAALHVTLQGVLTVSARSAADQRRGLAVAQGVLVAVMLGITALMTWLATSDTAAAQAPRAVAVGLCALFAAIGAVLGKVAPNPLVGIRTPWTRTSRLAWDKSNRLAGRLFFLGGLAGMMLTPLLPPFLAIRSLTAAALLIAAVCVFESWRVWRADPDRLPA